MKRRELLIVLGGVAVARPLAARAQQKAMPVIGYLHPGEPPDALGAVDLGLGAFRQGRLAAFREGLSETSYVEGKNLTVEYRWGESQYDRLPALAADLVGRKVDLIAAVGNAALAAKNATATIPIVFMGVGDPIAMGLVASLARPGGNLTGFSNLIGELIAKRLELLSDVVPKAGVIALLVNPNQPPAERLIQYVQEAARARGMEVPILKAGTEDEIDAAFASLVEPRVGGLVIAGDVFFYSRHEQLVALASRHAVPAIYAWRDVPLAGGLISYGIDNIAVWRQAGIYAGNILNGAKPADLPVQQPTKFELVINLKTAKALGLTIAPAILARADEVIE